MSLEKPNQNSQEHESSLESSRDRQNILELDEWIGDRLKQLGTPNYTEMIELSSLGEMGKRINNEEDQKSGYQNYTFLSSLFNSVDELRQACLTLERLNPSLQFIINEDRVAKKLIFEVSDLSKF